MTIDDLPLSPSAFLDGGTLISLFYFWEACEQAQVELDAVKGWKELKHALKAAGLDENLLKPTADINRGILTFHALTGSSNPKDCFSSRACWAEMHQALLEANALEKLVRGRVPRSLREQRPQLLYRSVLEEADYNKLKDQVQAFRVTMSANYIDIQDAEDPALNLGIDSAEIWEIAQEVWSLVLVDVPHAYIVASAIGVQADEFRSPSDVLRNALELLRDASTDKDGAATPVMQRLGLQSGMKVPRPVTPRKQGGSTGEAS